MRKLEFLLPEKAELEVNEVEFDNKQVSLKVSSNHPTARCPDCGQESDKVNTSYERNPSDLPCARNGIQLQMKVRSFFCKNEGCSHRTFAERFPGVVAPYARRTERRTEQQQEVAFALGGEAGARLLKSLGMPTSPDTLIRLIRRAPDGSGPTAGATDFLAPRCGCFWNRRIDILCQWDSTGSFRCDPCPFFSLEQRADRGTGQPLEVHQTSDVWPRQLCPPAPPRSWSPALS
ncbi:transposase family protein [Chloroflexi bacterium TSY]|nr:transposase family protein [Chloroflexi bacterium TSY]